jgi:PAS domain S-box-containing protein
LARSVFSSLRSRLLALLAVAVLPGLILQVYTALRHRSWAAQESQAQAVQLARSIADEQVRSTEAATAMLEALALNPILRGDVSGQCSALLADFQERHPRYTSLAVYGPSGEPICGANSSGSTSQPELVAAAVSRAGSTRRFSIGDYGIRPGSLKPSVALAYPISDPGTQDPFVLVATVDLELLGSFSRDARLPPYSAFLVVGADGTILSRFPDPEQWVGRPLPEFTDFASLITADPGILRRLKDVDGIERSYAVRALPTDTAGAAFVAVGFPTAAVYNQEDRLLALNVVLLLVFAGIALSLGGAVGTRFIVQPIHSILGATRRLSRGELSARAYQSHAEGELAELAVSFNEMADSLQHRTAETGETLAALRRSEQRYRSLVEASAAIVWRAAAEGGFDSEQSGWSLFTGQTEEELQGWRWLSAVHPDDRETVSTAWRNALESRGLFQVEQRLRKWDGEYRHMIMRALPIIGEDGEPREWIGVHLDITDRKVAEAERAALLAREREARAEAEEANRSKSDFLAVVSHELRTPLTSIISYAELMETDVQGQLCPRHREFMERIEASAWHLSALVEQILEFTRLEAGRVTVQLAMHDITRVVRAVAQEMEPLASAKGLALRTEIPGGAVVLRTDGSKFHQILSNFVSNAIKFTEAGEVRIELSTSAQEVRVHVHDSGPGIAPAHLGRIWETFWQAENPLTRRCGGTGLGLTIVRRLSLLLGGEVAVSSAVGEGSTFTLVLPQTEQGEVFDMAQPSVYSSR